MRRQVGACIYPRGNQTERASRNAAPAAEDLPEAEESPTPHTFLKPRHRSQRAIRNLPRSKYPETAYGPRSEVERCKSRRLRLRLALHVPQVVQRGRIGLFGIRTHPFTKVRPVALAHRRLVYQQSIEPHQGGASPNPICCIADVDRACRRLSRSREHTANATNRAGGLGFKFNLMARFSGHLRHAHARTV